MEIKLQHKKLFCYLLKSFVFDVMLLKKIELNLSESESVRSSSEDLRITEKSICCCSIDSRNPTIKRDRQLQLFKVNIQFL